jgi:hypothetical protein
MKDLTVPTDGIEANITGAQYRRSEKNTLVVIWNQKFRDAEFQEKLIAIRMAGDYILSLSLDNNTDDFGDAQKQLYTMLDNAVITQNGKPLVKP